MSVFDIVVLLFLLISAILGFSKVFAKQMFGLLAIILGIYCAFKFSGLVSSILSNWVETDESVLKVAAFIITLLLVWIGIILLGKVLDKLLKLAALGLVNRLFGAVFAIAQTLLVFSALVYAFGFLGMSKNESVKKEISKSVLYTPLKQVAETALPYLNFNKFNEI